MTEDQKIKDSFLKCQKIYTLKPEKANVTARSESKAVNGLTCEVTERDWKFNVDLPVGAGGNGTAPTPGVYGRAAFGSCLAITYLMYAARNGIEIKKLSVNVEADYDDSVLFGIGKGRSGYNEIRYTVNIESDADEDVITTLLDEAESVSAYLDIFRNPMKCTRKINLYNTINQ